MWEQERATLTFSVIDYLTAFDDRLRMLLLEALAYARVKDLFDIIVEFPDSMEAVTDLKEWFVKGASWV